MKVCSEIPWVKKLGQLLPAKFNNCTWDSLWTFTVIGFPDHSSSTRIDQVQLSKIRVGQSRSRFCQFNTGYFNYLNRSKYDNLIYCKLS